MPKAMPPDTVQLIRQSLAGRQEAFAILYERYKNLVYRTAYLTLGNTSYAEDALQEVFLQVYRSLAQYDPARAAFSTWLHRITINYCLNHRRRRIKSLLKRFGMDEAAPRRTGEYSKGMRQRLALYNNLSHRKADLLACRSVF